MIEFNWKDISRFESDNNGDSFNFEYERQGKKPRLVRIFTNFVSKNASYINLFE